MPKPKRTHKRTTVPYYKYLELLIELHEVKLANVQLNMDILPRIFQEQSEILERMKQEFHQLTSGPKKEASPPPTNSEHQPVQDLTVQ